MKDATGAQDLRGSFKLRHDMTSSKVVDAGVREAFGIGRHPLRVPIFAISISTAPV